MDTLGDLVGRERRSGDIALQADADERAISYRDFCTTAWKAGNFLRYLGVGPDDTVAVADDPAPEPVLTFFGAALLGARTRFGVDAAAGGGGRDIGGARVVAVPVFRESEFDLSGGSRLLVYGGEPTNSRTAYWEGDVWSENPAFPPVDVSADAAALLTDDAAVSHATLLESAAAVAADYDLDATTSVAVRSPLGQPGTVVAGLLAPLLAGATVAFPGPETVCDLAVGVGPEDERIDPSRVL